MRFRDRIFLAGIVVCASMALSAPLAQAAPEFGVETFVAASCNETHPNCIEEKIPFGPLEYSVPKEPNPTEAREGAFSQAAGRQPFGVTAFSIKTIGTIPEATPTGIVTHVRTDVGVGVSTNPQAVGQCSMEEFEGTEEASGVFTPPTCEPAETEIGINKVVVYLGPSATPKDLPLQGKVYNVVPPNGDASLFAVALELPAALTGGTPGLVAHTLIEGHVEWAGDYHDYYEINVSPAIPLIASRLSLFGNKGTTGQGGFITNPSNCVGPGPATTNTLTLQSSASQEGAKSYVTPIGTEGCLGEAPFASVPFEPGFKLTPETAQSDQPDGITAEATVPHPAGATSIDSSQVRTGTFTLPEGMTLNPSAAQGLKACTATQIGIKTRNPVQCPEASKLGTVTLTVPDLPATEPLEGNVYLGGTEPLTKSPYTMYVDAESARYGISVRLQGTVTTNETTGQVTTVFADNPQQPFSNLTVHFKGGALAPIANPLACGTAKTVTSFAPYTGTANKLPFSEFTVGSNAAGAACASPLPFALTQSTASVPTTGGAATNFTLNLGRADGQQYLSRVSATLPAGLVGKIPAVPLCPEPQASLGTCASTSQIGTATATVGSGPTPVQFTGPVYLTGPTGKAPYGMTTVINAAVGPFSLGNDVVRTGIEINPFTARVTVAGEVPTIFKGVPLRLKALTVAINKPGFLVNPTSCGALTTNTTLTSSFGATQSLSTPFQATNCSALGFKPKFTSASNGKTSRPNGASLTVKVGYKSGESNLKSVFTTLPKQLPSRLTTLKKACLEATFNANPFACPSSSRVGGATVRTPVLPDKLTGPAFFVSHGGAAFPDLDLVVTGDGVTIILVGNTNIVKGVTSSNFASLPDAPVSSVEVNLPLGANSALGAPAGVCKQSLVMPTTLTAQNGKVIKQNTPISVSGCPVTILSRHVSGHKAIVTLRAPAAGRVSGSGKNLNTRYKHPGKAKTVTLEVPLSAAGVKALAARSPLAVRLRVGFLPKKGASSIEYTTVVFK